MKVINQVLRYDSSSPPLPPTFLIVSRFGILRYGRQELLMEVTIVYIQGKATENHIEIPKTTNMK